MNFFKSFKDNFFKIIGLFLAASCVGTFIILYKDVDLSKYKFLIFLDKRALFLIFLFLFSIIGMSILGFVLVIRTNKIRKFGVQKDPWLKERFKVFLGLQREKDCVEEYFNSIKLLLKSFLKNNSNYQYELPWYVTFGAEGAGKSGFMNSITLDKPLKSNIDNENYLNHYFFNNGIVIDLKTDLLFNDASHDFSWYGLVDNLKKSRREKGIDGIIYFVSLQELMEDSKTGKNNLKKQNELLYSKLWYMQNKFEMKIPVYVVFTHLDYIKGFKEFSDIMQDYQNDIFGWSNPKSIDSKFESSLIDEMYSALDSSLKFVQSEMMVNFSEEVSFDMMNFLNNFKKTQTKVAEFLESTFKNNKYATGLYFRGAYFSALEAYQSKSEKVPFLEGESIEYSQSVIESKKLYFGNDLLDKKIFLEQNIGKDEMDRKSLLHSLKKFKIFTAVFSLFAVSYTYKVFNDCLYIEDSLQQKILKIIETVDQAEKIPDYNQSKEFKDDLKLILIYLEELARYNLSFYGVPSSWICSVNRNKNKLFFKAYNKLILENLYKEITAQYEVLSKKRFTLSYDLDTSLISPLEMNEFKNLESLINDLSRLESYEKRMKAIIEYNSISNLKYLLLEIYNIELAGNFAKKIMYANNAEDNELLNYRISVAKKNIKKKFNWCLYQFDTNCFSFERIKKYFNDLNGFLLLVDADSTVLNIDNIRAIQLKISGLISFLNSPSSDWLKIKHFSPAKYMEMMDKIACSNTLEVSENFFLQVENSYNRFKKELSDHQLVMVGSPVYLSSNKSIEISPKIFEVHGILNNIFSESFMITPNKKPLENIAKNEHIKWDPIVLDEISKIIRDYESFMTRKSSNKFEESVKLIANNNIIDVIQHKLVRAKKVVILKDDKAYLADLAANIKRNAQNICEILNFIKKNSSDFFITLKTIEKYNLLNYLQSVHVNLERDNLYQISKDSLGLDIEDKKIYYKMNLGEYLLSQRDLLEFYVRDLASYAVKNLEYIKFLENGKISTLVSKFKGLEVGLDSYKINPSMSDLYKLEQFFSRIETTSLNFVMSDLKKNSKLLATDRYLENKIILLRTIVRDFLYNAIVNLVDEQYLIGKDFFNEYAITFPFNLHGELIGLRGYEAMDYLAKKQRSVLDAIFIIDPNFKPRTVEFVDNLEKCSKLINFIKSDEEYLVMKFKPYQSIGELYEKNLRYLINFSAKVPGQNSIAIYWVGELKIYDNLELEVDLAANSNVRFSGIADKEGYKLLSGTSLRIKLNRKQLVKFLLENIKIINNQSFIRFTIDIEDDKGRRDKMVLMMPVDLTLNGLHFDVPQKSFNKLLGDSI